jgi:hypothetical protein
MARAGETVRIGNGAGFWGDNLDAPFRLAQDGGLDFLTLEYLAELTLSMLAHQRRRDPEAGFVADFPATLERLIPVLKAKPALRVVTNAGGLNPEGCARVTARHLAEAGLGETAIAWVEGDDLLPRLGELRAAGETFAHFDAPERRPPEEFVSANAYLGARPIAAALDAGARIVITGRVADASLTVGPALHAFHWGWEDWDKLAMASVAGHLIECGAQATGGLRTRWRGLPGFARVGYPIAVLAADGGCAITKPAGSGGVVDAESVAEQLLYEIGDPARYLTPDVILDLTGVSLENQGPDMIRVKGARGLPPPAELKVSCAFAHGFAARGDLVVCGDDAVAKARYAGELIRERVRLAGYALARSEVELLGTGVTLPGGFRADGPYRDWAARQAEAAGKAAPPREVVLRVSAWDPRREAIERFGREFSPLITAGPPGITGYAGSRPKTRPVLSYWPTKVARSRVSARWRMRTAAELAPEAAKASGRPKSPSGAAEGSGPGPMEAEKSGPGPFPPGNTGPGSETAGAIGTLRGDSAADRAPDRSFILLGDIAHGRSGDKGDHANIGVLAYTGEGHAFLSRMLTAASVADWFHALRPSRVERFELTALPGFNFLLRDVLGGGASDSLRTDSQGKALATALLAMPLPRPENLAAMLPPGGGSR